MRYVLTFIEGILTFISPCFLPLLPVYLTYLGGSANHTLRKNAVGFVLGFSGLFVLMGAGSGMMGSWLMAYRQILNVVCGFIVILCGLSYMGFGQWLMRWHHHFSFHMQNLNFLRSLLFGLIFGISWTPCVGTFLASALMLAASQSSVIQGMLLLFCYALGLALPLLLSAVLLDQLNQAFNWIKTHYTLINRCCGILLVITGIFMMFGQLESFLYYFS